MLDMVCCLSGVLHFIRELPRDLWVFSKLQGSSGWVASLSAELALLGPSWLAEAQGPSSLTESQRQQINYGTEGQMWLPGCWDKGGGCSRVIPTAEETGMERRALRLRNKQGEVARKSTGRQIHVPAPRAAHPGPCRASPYRAGCTTP